jgi:class 3 adenylate cyclase
MKCKIYLSHPEHGARETAFDQSSILIGRATSDGSQVDIDLSPDRKVSRSHCRVTYESGWWAEDLGSSHGTALDNAPIKGKVRLHSGAQLTAGEWLMTFYPQVAFQEEDTLPPVTLEAEATTLIGDELAPHGSEKYPPGFVDKLLNLIELSARDPVREPPEEYLRSLADLLKKHFTFARSIDFISLSTHDGSLAIEYLLPRTSSTAPISRTLAERVNRTQKAMLLSDSEKETPDIRSLAGQTRSAIYVPLIAFGKLEGILCVASSLPGAFKEHDLAYSRVAAYLAAFRIYYHRLNQKLRSREQTLSHVRPHIPDKVWKLFLERAEPIKKFHRSSQVAVVCIRINGYLALRDTLPSWETLETLNEYTGQITGILQRLDGTTERWNADQIVAFFGIPEEDEGYIRKALFAAWEIQRQMKLWTTMHRGQKCEDITVSCAVHMGYVVHGFVGPETRLNYAAMGAPITIAAKICEKACPGEVLVSHDIWNNSREFIDTAAFEEYKRDGMAEPVYVASLQNVRMTA